MFISISVDFIDVIFPDKLNSINLYMHIYVLMKTFAFNYAVICVNDKL